MDRDQRWGNKAEQRQARAIFAKRPQHARVPLRVLSCVDCREALPLTHPHAFGARCAGCWEALGDLAEVEVYG